MHFFLCVRWLAFAEHNFLQTPSTLNKISFCSRWLCVIKWHVGIGKSGSSSVLFVSVFKFFNWRRFFFNKQAKMTEKILNVLNKFYDEYMSNTPKKLKIIDAYLFYVFMTGVMQFLYILVVGTFPFNSFLSGFISSVGSFVLAGKITSYFVYLCIFLTISLCV